MAHVSKGTDWLPFFVFITKDDVVESLKMKSHLPHHRNWDCNRFFVHHDPDTINSPVKYTHKITCINTWIEDWNSRRQGCIYLMRPQSGEFYIPSTNCIDAKENNFVKIPGPPISHCWRNITVALWNWKLYERLIKCKTCFWGRETITYNYREWLFEAT